MSYQVSETAMFIVCKFIGDALCIIGNKDLLWASHYRLQRHWLIDLGFDITGKQCVVVDQDFAVKKELPTFFFYVQTKVLNPQSLR